MEHSDHRRRGFTLVELVVAVAILGVLASLAIPTYERLRIRMRRSEMMETMRQISADQMIHQADQGSFWPEGFSIGPFTYAFEIYPAGTSIELEGQNRSLRLRSKSYTYYVYRFEPIYDEPIVYAIAQSSMGNDLDRDPYPDIWIKIGTGEAQVYYDDLTDSWHPVNWS